MDPVNVKPGSFRAMTVAELRYRINQMFRRVSACSEIPSDTSSSFIENTNILEEPNRSKLPQRVEPPLANIEAVHSPLCPDTWKVSFESPLLPQPLPLVDFNQSKKLHWVTPAAIASDNDDEGEGDFLGHTMETSIAKILTDQEGNLGSVNEYEIFLPEIGEGAFGKVYLAESSTGEQVAIKAIPRAKVNEHHTTKIYAEVEILKSLKHKNIVGLLEVIDDEEKDTLFLVLELVPGKSLATVSPSLELSRTLRSAGEIKNFMCQMTSALKYVHRRHIAHGDIKPENILCLNINSDDTLEIRLADFGTSRLVKHDEGSALSSSPMSPLRGVVTGTPYFKSPELFAGNSPTPASDMWAFGITLYALLYGKLPFRGSTLHGLLQTISEGLCFPDIDEHDVPSYVSEWNPVITQLLDPNPERRMTISELCLHLRLTYGCHMFPETLSTSLSFFSPPFEKQNSNTQKVIRQSSVAVHFQSL